MARSKLDPGVKFVHASTDRGRPQTQFTCFADEAVPARNWVNILLESEADWQDSQALQAALRNVEFRVHAWARTVVSGEIPVGNVEMLDKLPGLRRVEASRVLRHELDEALPESRVPVSRGPMRHRGDGVIVGIIDTGIDFTHPSFKNEDGSTRILAIWDQGLKPIADESSPQPYNYGVLYTDDDITNALLPQPKANVRHRDIAPFHGTHVAGIAAGNGHPAEASDGVVKYVGMAPCADLVIVANTRSQASNPGTLGDSADTFDAIDFITKFAARAGKPVVINHSQGDNIGPHDGSSLLEVGIDQLITGPGQVMVKSAGNEGNTGHTRNHAQGDFNDEKQSQPHRVEIDVDGSTELMVDFWYEHNNHLELRIVSPVGHAHSFGPGVDHPHLKLANGNIASVFTDEDDPVNHDNRIFVVLRDGEKRSIERGKWKFELKGTGSWHGWIQRDSLASFATFDSPEVTISIPGTAKSVISVGAYQNKKRVAGRSVGEFAGQLSDLSSWGPTRDGRRAPTLTAPGDDVTSTIPGPSFLAMAGTSMSAPLVAGVAALMLQINNTLTAKQVRDILCRTARLDDQTGSRTSDRWGAGKLDAREACKMAVASVRPSVRPRRAAPVDAGAPATIRASR